MLDLKRMLQDIDLLVNTDFCEEMESKSSSKIAYTYKEAKKMAKIIASVYSISHCITCKSCGNKYKK